jgi:hypothetical protein
MFLHNLLNVLVQIANYKKKRKDKKSLITLQFWGGGGVWGIRNFWPPKAKKFL